jgi:hypothetical protein
MSNKLMSVAVVAAALVVFGHAVMVCAHVTNRIYTLARQPESLPLWPFGLDQV